MAKCGEGGAPEGRGRRSDEGVGSRCVYDVNRNEEKNQSHYCERKR